MKENDIVTLKNFNKKYQKYNLYENVNGIVLKKLPYNKTLVLFLNDKIMGDYATIEVDNNDIESIDIKLPMDIIYELKQSDKLNENNLLKKQTFEELKFKEYDFVELLVEKEAYTKYGIHKGDIGVIAIDYASNDTILVDFSSFDESGNYYGDCIQVKLKDLKKINKE